MPYTVPTATEFKARHPAFDSQTDAYVDALIADAARFVDTSWLEDDYQPAIMFLAAHMLIGEGALGDSVSGGGTITSEKLGDASISYGNAISEAKSVSDYGSTAYGRRFLALLRVNQPAVVVV